MGSVGVDFAGDPTDDIMISTDGEDLIFSDDTFPPLPDFPCVSSSSLSSSSSSWNFLNLDGDMQQPAEVPSDHRPTEIAAALTSDLNIDLLDLTGDPKCLFPDDIMMIEAAEERQHQQQHHQQQQPQQNLARVFLDWLKNNKDGVSLEDLRTIKLKKSTIDCAARRLGGGNQGRTRLLKLILTWVQNHHLQRWRRRHHRPQMYADPNPNSWIPCPADPVSMMSPPPYHYPTPFSPSTEFNFPAAATPYSPFSGGGPIVSPKDPCGYGAVQYPGQHFYNQAQPPPGQQASATKEARKKRMAHQRRFSSFHHNRNKPQQQNPVPVAEPSSRVSCLASCANSRNWAFFSSTSDPIPPQLLESPNQQIAPLPPLPQPPTLPSPPAQQLNSQRNSFASVKHQGWKAEKNMGFLLQKVLKQSNVGSSLGRIVLPKVSDPLQEGSGNPPPGTGRKGWNLDSDGGHRDLPCVEHAVQEWDSQKASQIATELCGFITILSGTFLLHKTKDMDNNSVATEPNPSSAS